MSAPDAPSGPSTEPQPQAAEVTRDERDPLPHTRTPALAVRGGIGGLLMGAANTVPGVSGGSMLLLMGVYTAFLAALANLTSFRWRSWRSWLLVGMIGCGAATSILLLAGPMKWLVVTYRFQVYCVLIGMRLGIVPVVWRLAVKSPGSRASLWYGIAAGLLASSAAAVLKYYPDLLGLDAASGGMLFFGGLIAAAVMILPGLDGSYVLMLLGQYAVVLGAVDRFKTAFFSRDTAGVMAELGTLLPFGFGAALGLGGMAMLMRWLLVHFPKPTFGVLVGMLLGALIGLYPFGTYVQPEVGQTVRGVLVTPESMAPGGRFSEAKRENWPVEMYTPTTAQVGLALLLVLAGFAAAYLLSLVEPEEAPKPEPISGSRPEGSNAAESHAPAPSAHPPPPTTSGPPPSPASAPAPAPPPAPAPDGTPPPPRG
jgi:putative membrane protein